MPTIHQHALDATSLTTRERHALEHAVRELGESLGEDLEAVWLFGSRARGEPPREESDVDLLVIARDVRRRREQILDVVWDAAEAEGAKPAFFSVHVHDAVWLARRREIEAFFIQEVDRDKVVLAGHA